MDNLSWREKIDQFKIPIALSLVGLVLILGGVFASDITKQQPKAFPKESIVDTQKIISIDVSGAVKKSGVYQLKEGSRIEDAVLAAGGFSEQASQEYIAKYLNMAQKLVDGSKVYVPVEGEQGTVNQAGVVAGVNTQAKVNINTASSAELEALPGIGAVTAEKIISSRPYQGVEDLLSKKVVGKSVFEKIKDQLVVY